MGGVCVSDQPHALHVGLAATISSFNVHYLCMYNGKLGTRALELSIILSVAERASWLL